MYSIEQEKRIEKIFKDYRQYSVDRIIRMLHLSSRKSYYSRMHSDAETVIKLAKICQIPSSVIIDELMPTLNYTLTDDNNPRNTTILNGIKNNLSIEMINQKLHELKENPF